MNPPDAREADEREHGVRGIIEQLVTWAKHHSEIRALAMVGSRSRGTSRSDSDSTFSSSLTRQTASPNPTSG